MDGYVLIFYLYAILLGLLSLYGVHRYFLLLLYWRKKRNIPYPPKPLKEWPSVTIQLPIYNEYNVVEALLHQVSQIDYPQDRLLIQVLDDSTDETQDLLQKKVKYLQKKGVPIQYFHRKNRTGFKAGALQWGLEQTNSEFIAIFDADFQPSKDFLKKTIPYFAEDPKLAMVQARWEFWNRKDSKLTYIQGLFLDGHFILEHGARWRGGLFFNFNGTAGVWRKAAILDSGGWQGDTLTEDLDLSYRVQLKGWKFLFLPHLTCQSELPSHILAYKSQQKRWTKGAIQVSKKVLPQVWKSSYPFIVKMEATSHLLSNLCYLFLPLLILLFPWTFYGRTFFSSFYMSLFELSVLGFSFLPLSLFYGVAQKERMGEWKGVFPHIPLLFALGIGISISNGLGVLEGLLGYQTPFVRTPKEGKRPHMDAKTKGKRYTLPLSISFYMEGIFLLYSLGTLIFLGLAKKYIPLLFAGLFFLGFGWVFWATWKMNRIRRIKSK